MQEASCKGHLDGACGGGISGGDIKDIWEIYEHVWREYLAEASCQETYIWEASGRLWGPSGRHLAGIWRAFGGRHT